MAVERLSLHLSPEAKRRLTAEVDRRKRAGQAPTTASQTGVVQELIMSHLPPVEPSETPDPDERRA